MQGIHQFIPTERKAKYINTLLEVGFDTIDFGSFVSPKAIPQLKDTAQVLPLLNLSNSSKLLAIVANLRGAKEASYFEEITYLGFPLSISETFQQKNTNKSIREALQLLDEIQEVCMQNSKKLVVYISMGFGNPYGDPYNDEVVSEYCRKLIDKSIEIISLADTVGVARDQQISNLFDAVIKEYPKIEFGAHFHSRPEQSKQKIEAAYKAGCRRFDGALNGYGGCPMAKDDLVGNIATEKIIEFSDENNIEHGLEENKLQEALLLAPSIFL